MNDKSAEGAPTKKGRSLWAPWVLSLFFSVTTIVAAVVYFDVHATVWHGPERPVPGYGMRLESYLGDFKAITSLLALVLGILAVFRSEDKLRDWSVLGLAILALAAGSFYLM